MGVKNHYANGKEEKVIPTVCASHCGGSCLLNVHVKNGVVTRIETDNGKEPQLRGCMRGRAYRQRIYAPDRLLYPLRRKGERGRGEFKRISWDEALTITANNLKRIRDTYGPASIILVSMGGDVTVLHRPYLVHRLLSMAGGYTATFGLTSFGQGMFSSVATYGTLHASNSRGDLLNTRMVILWGFDPAKCINGTNTAWYLAQAKERGARVISVDPALGDTAAVLGDQWIPIRPSTDLAMLLAMAYVMIVENLYDRAFVEKYTFGFEEYKRYLLGLEDGAPKTPAWAQAITSVPAEVTVALAREYATTKPAALLAGISPGRTACGELYHRAAAILAAMTGNVGIHGGDAASRAWESFCGGLPYKISPIQGLPVVNNPVEEGFPLVKNFLPAYRGPRVPYAKMADAIIKGKAGGYHTDYKMLFIVNSNYVNAMPNINKITQALKLPEFIVINEQFMTPTAKFADIILPTCTYMERNDITMGAQTHFYGFQNKMIEPLGESKSQFDMYTALAEKLGLLGFNEWGTEEHWLQKIANDVGIRDYNQFRKEAIHPINDVEPYVAFREQIEDPDHYPFPTLSGKIEIYSQVMAEWNNPNLPPIPKWVEPYEILSDPLVKKYPLQLITPHGKRRALGQFDNIPWLREVELQTVRLSTVDAEVRGINNGDVVKVFNGRGTLALPAEVTGRLTPGVVLIESGAWYDPDGNGVDRGGNTNVLIRDEISLAGHFPYNTCLVEVAKL